MTAFYHCVPRGIEVALDTKQGIYTGIQGNNEIILKKKYKTTKLCSVKSQILKIVIINILYKQLNKGNEGTFFLVRNTNERSWCLQCHSSG